MLKRTFEGLYSFEVDVYKFGCNAKPNECHLVPVHEIHRKYSFSGKDRSSSNAMRVVVK